LARSQFFPELYNEFFGYAKRNIGFLSSFLFFSFFFLFCPDDVLCLICFVLFCFVLPSLADNRDERQVMDEQESSTTVVTSTSSSQSTSYSSSSSSTTLVQQTLMTVIYPAVSLFCIVSFLSPGRPESSNAHHRFMGRLHSPFDAFLRFSDKNEPHRQARSQRAQP
jgi:hypothetical protein